MGQKWMKEGRHDVEKKARTLKIAEAKSIPTTSDAPNVAKAEIVGVVDPDSTDVFRVLGVGKNWSWSKIVKLLTSTKDPVKDRYRALTLAFKMAPSKEELVVVMERALECQKESLLLRHEIAYMIGQAGNSKALQILRRILFDELEDEVVRHEAAEALWAICCLSDGRHEALRDIESFLDHTSKPLAQTCELVVEGMREELKENNDDENSKSAKESSSNTYTNHIPVGICSCQTKVPLGSTKLKKATAAQFESRDPASAISGATRDMIPKLGKMLRDESLSLLQRYRAMFTLRNLGGEEAVKVLCDALETDKSSEIMRHEVAFVLGQMASTCDRSELAIPSLARVLARPREHGMVRHEAALAIGCLGTWSKESFRRATKALRAFSRDSDALVAESCECALDDLTAPIDWVGKDGW